MMCGDHFYDDAFQNSYWSGKIKIANEAPLVDNTRVNAASLGDNEWYLRNCKTPIMTGFKLISFIVLFFNC